MSNDNLVKVTTSVPFQVVSAQPFTLPDISRTTSVNFEFSLKFLVISKDIYEGKSEMIGLFKLPIYSYIFLKKTRQRLQPSCRAQTCGAELLKSWVRLPPGAGLFSSLPIPQ